MCRPQGVEDAGSPVQRPDPLTLGSPPASVAGRDEFALLQEIDVAPTTWWSAVMVPLVMLLPVL